MLSLLRETEEQKAELLRLTHENVRLQAKKKEFEKKRWFGFIPAICGMFSRENATVSNGNGHIPAPTMRPRA
jgi:hypothetical protein